MSVISTPDGNGSSQSATIPYAPVEGQREAATKRKKSSPYRFPRNGHLLGGKFTVVENARRLLRFLYFERRLMQALGAHQVLGRALATVYRHHIDDTDQSRTCRRFVACAASSRTTSRCSTGLSSPSRAKTSSGWSANENRHDS